MKLLSADDSLGSPHVKVGHCQAFFLSCPKFMKALIYITLLILILLSLFFLIMSWKLSYPSYKGSITENFDGTYFHNRIKDNLSPLKLIKLGLGSLYKSTGWPTWVVSKTNVIPRNRVTGNKYSVTFINHATVLIQKDDINILTDPVFSDRVSPVSWMGPKRVRNSGVSINDLPDIDVILISHNHYDHLDIASLKKIISNQKVPPIILTGLGNKALLESNGFSNTFEFDWWQSMNMLGFEFIFTEARHRSGRAILDQNKTLWGGFIIKSSNGSIFFAGDTGMGPHFEDIYNKDNNILFSIIPIGAYKPKWFMDDKHLNPLQALQTHNILHSKNSMAIHYGTFKLSYEGIDEPVVSLKSHIANSNGLYKNFHVFEFGETKEFDI